MGFIAKTLISALLIAAASELGKRSSLLGGLVASLPLTSVLALCWLYADGRDAAAVAALSRSVFWAVAASLPMFPALSWLLGRGVGFPAALAASCAVAGLGYSAFAFLARAR